jgi:hypothetical protein
MRLYLLAAASVALAVAGASGTIDGNAAPTQWRVVVLGDSGASGSGDSTGLGWGRRYGRLVQQRYGLRVVVTNLAREGKSAARLLREMRTDARTRAAVGSSDIILFGSAAGANLNQADANLEAGRCSGQACYSAELSNWSRDFAAIVASAVKLRAGKKTVLRGVTEPNVVPGAQDVIPAFATVSLGLYQAKTIRQKICATMRAHTGRCIDVLTAFNGRSGTGDAYKSGLMNKQQCCYPSAAGQQVIARLLLKTGLAPLR